MGPRHARMSARCAAGATSTLILCVLGRRLPLLGTYRAACRRARDGRPTRGRPSIRERILVRKGFQAFAPPIGTHLL